MKEKGIKAISIPPYSPQLNPAEKLIGVIKSQIRRIWINDKPLNLKTVEKIVDKINSETWRKWILSSRIESINRLVSFQNQRSEI